MKNLLTCCLVGASFLAIASGVSNAEESADDRLYYTVSVEKPLLEDPKIVETIMSTLAVKDISSTSSTTELVGFKSGKPVEKTTIHIAVDPARRSEFASAFKRMKQNEFPSAYLEISSPEMAKYDQRRMIEITTKDVPTAAEGERLARLVFDATGIDELSLGQPEQTFEKGVSLGRTNIYATIPDEDMGQVKEALETISKDGQVVRIDLSASPRYLVSSGRGFTVYQK